MSVTISKPAVPRGESYENLTELAADPQRHGRLYQDQSGVLYVYALGFTAPTPLVRLIAGEAPVIMGVDNITRIIAWPLVPALSGTTVTIQQP